MTGVETQLKRKIVSMQQSAKAYMQGQDGQEWSQKVWKNEVAENCWSHSVQTTLNGYLILYNHVQIIFFFDKIGLTFL